MCSDDEAGTPPPKRARRTPDGMMRPDDPTYKSSARGGRGPRRKNPPRSARPTASMSDLSEASIAALKVVDDQDQIDSTRIR